MFEIQLAVSALRKIPRRPSHFRVHRIYIHVSHAKALILYSVVSQGQKLFTRIEQHVHIKIQASAGCH